MVDAPDLDDRTFEEVFAEARRQIPVQTDEWTDHNTHDTGIAILEMLAWLTETYTYQLDQVTDEHREKYLKLLGITRRPPEPASARVVVELPEEVTGAATVPAGEKLSVDDGSGERRTFETVSETTVTDAGIDRVITHAGGDIVNTTSESRTSHTRFQAFGDDPAAGDALYLGFDRDPFAAADTLTLTFDLYDEDLPEPAGHGDIEAAFEPSVSLSWEYPTSYEDWDDDDAWTRLEVLEDDTNAFYEGGDVTLAKPPAWETVHAGPDPTGILEQDPGLVWVRCRVAEAGYEIPPQFDTVRLNVLEAAHRETVEGELLERADGTLETTYEGNQEFFFGTSPVIDAEIEIDGQRWTEVQDLDRSDSLDRHYVLDHTRGSITFGDGVDGRKPPVREHVTATGYVHGGGTEGNVAADSEWEFVREDAGVGETTLGEVDVSATGSASGGTDMESIEEAINRFRRDFKRPYRAATLDDFEFVATHTPGLRFGRAHARRAERTVAGRSLDEIEVVVVPYSRQTEPTPSEGFLEAVETHIERTRLVTDVVRVREPTYVQVDIDVVISALSGYTDAELRAAITETLVARLHPIENGGWPFGHPLYVSDVEGLIEELPGVGSVDEVSVSASGELRVNEYGDVLIADNALFALSERNVWVTING